MELYVGMVKNIVVFDLDLDVSSLMCVSLCCLFFCVLILFLKFGFFFRALYVIC